MSDAGGRELFGYRAHLTKGENIRYVSHLDYASIMRRAICRAKLPAAYSEGFNPHMRMSFASALAVGVTSDAEYMDFELTERMDSGEVAKRLSDALPDGVKLIALSAAKGKLPPLMAAVDEARYEALVTLNGSANEARQAVADFNSADKCVFRRVTPKKTREIDAKEYIKGDVLFDIDEGGQARISFAVRVAPNGSVKPGELISLICERFSFPADDKSALISRKGLFSKGKTPMELLDR